MNRTGYIALIIVTAALSLLLFRQCFTGNNPLNNEDTVADLIGGSTEPIIDSPTGEKIIPARNNKELNNYLNEGIANFDEATGWINSALREITDKRNIARNYNVYDFHKNSFSAKEADLGRKKSNIGTSRVALINAYNNSNKNELQQYLTQSRNYVQESKDLASTVSNIVISKPQPVVKEKIVENKPSLSVVKAKDEAKRKAAIKIADLYKSVLNEITALNNQINTAGIELKAKRSKKLSESSIRQLRLYENKLNETHNTHVTKAKSLAENYRRIGSESKLLNLKSTIISNSINISNIIASIKGIPEEQVAVIQQQPEQKQQPLIPLGSEVFEKYQDVATEINNTEFLITTTQANIDSKIAQASKSDVAVLDKFRNDLFKFSSSLNRMITRADQYHSSKDINSLLGLKKEVEDLKLKIKIIQDATNGIKLIETTKQIKEPNNSDKRKLPRVAYEAESLIKQITQTKSTTDIDDFKGLFRSQDIPCITGTFAGHIGEQMYTVSDYLRKCRLEGPKIVTVRNAELDSDGKIISMVIAETKIR